MSKIKDSLTRIPLALPIRLGAGFMFLYSSVNMFRFPGTWVWAVPPWFSRVVEQFIPIETFLKTQAVGEFVLGLLFLAWFLKTPVLKYVSLFAALHIAAILAFGNAGIDSITFRDLGVLGGLVTLALIYWTGSPTSTAPSSVQATQTSNSASGKKIRSAYFAILIAAILVAFGFYFFYLKQITGL